MLRNVGIVLMIGAALCVLPPAIGYFEDGQWLWPGFTIGALLGDIGLTGRLGPLQPFVDPLAPANPGWVLLVLGFLCYLKASSRVE